MSRAREEVVAALTLGMTSSALLIAVPLILS
jgi:hypothetical protein